MVSLLLPVRPEYTAAIFSGEKRYEYTKFRFCNADRVLILEDDPVHQIVGECVITDRMEGTPDEIWEKTHEGSGMSESAYRKYFDHVKIAFAYKIENAVNYDHPLELSDIGVESAPSSFRYVRDME